MGGSENDGSNRQVVPVNVRQEAENYEDEINLIDYFRVLWKRRYFIILGSVLPALVVGLITFSRPRDYKMTYLYDVGLDEKGYKRDVGLDGKGYKRDVGLDEKGYKRDVGLDEEGYKRDVGLDGKAYKILLDKFYSAENLDRLTSKLRENGLDEYAQKIAGANTDEALKALVDFEVSPPYMDIAGAKITDPVALEQIRQLSAQLLNMTVVGRPKNDIPKISLVIRDNLENVISVYTVEQQLIAAARRLRASVADIEENSFGLELTLKTNKAVLAKLKNIKTSVSDRSISNIALQFDISGKTEYLPAEYQIQAAESKTVQLEEQIAANEETYNHYKDLLALNEKLLAELRGKMSSYYTIQQFHSFLTALVNSYESKELKSYLNSYIKRIENIISANIPVTERPKIYSVAKGTINKTVKMFGVLLIITMFVAFLLEALKKSQAQAS